MLSQLRKRDVGELVSTFFGTRARNRSCFFHGEHLGYQRLVDLDYVLPVLAEHQRTNSFDEYYYELTRRGVAFVRMLLAECPKMVVEASQMFLNRVDKEVTEVLAIPLRKLPKYLTAADPKVRETALFVLSCYKE